MEARWPVWAVGFGGGGQGLSGGCLSCKGGTGGDRLSLVDEIKTPAFLKATTRFKRVGSFLNEKNSWGIETYSEK